MSVLNFEMRKKQYEKALRADESFDIVVRELQFGNRFACMYFVDGMIKDDTLQRLIQQMTDISADNFPETASEFIKRCISQAEIDLVTETDKMVVGVLSGVPHLLIEGYPELLAIDARTYPARGVEEPEKDRVMRGSRDGFVETLVFNTALVRRRIRDARLTMEYHEAGTVSHTDMVLCYMSDRIDKKLLDKVKTGISKITAEALTMNQESLAEVLYKKSYWNPFPKFRYTERPDTVAASVLEGYLAVFMDNSPAVMLLPTTVFDIIEEADDYYFPPVTSTYLRLSRLLTNILALILTPAFLLFMKHPDWFGEALSFAVITDEINIPLWLQFLILEFAIDGLRLASLNTPSMLTLPLSVIAALVMGEVAASTGWFNPEVMFYMAFVALANYTQSSFELGYALKFLRIILLCLTALFDIVGFCGGLVLAIFLLVTNKTVTGGNYVHPGKPLGKYRIWRRLIRLPLRNHVKKN